HFQAPPPASPSRPSVRGSTPISTGPGCPAKRAKRRWWSSAKVRSIAPPSPPACNKRPAPLPEMFIAGTATGLDGEANRFSSETLAPMHSKLLPLHLAAGPVIAGLALTYGIAATLLDTRLDSQFRFVR